MNLGVVSHGNGYDQLVKGEREDKRAEGQAWRLQPSEGTNRKRYPTVGGTERKLEREEDKTEPIKEAVLWESGGQLGHGHSATHIKRPKVVRTDGLPLSESHQ